jgi:biopolymer transport protein ExbB
MTFARLAAPRAWLVLAVGLLLLTPDLLLAQGESAAPAAKKNIILHIIESVGLFYGVLLGVTSLILVALIVLLALDLKMAHAIPPGFVDEFTDTVNKRKFKEAFDMAKNDASFLGRVMTAGMSRLQYGLDDAREAAANQLDAIRSDKDQKNNYTAVIGTLGPMLGLVGTVSGMIRSFMELGTGGPIEPAKLAEGISEALSVTLIGIGISVPAIFFNAYFRNRITRLTMDTGHIADDLLTQMYHNSKKAASAPASAAAQAAPPPPPKV